jgi:hypothetical protein
MLEEKKPPAGTQKQLRLEGEVMVISSRIVWFMGVDELWELPK